MPSSRAVVVGGGVIGCAAALELRRRGWAVDVVEREGEVGHGSTSASCGIVRRFYSQPGMVALAHESAQIWADWPAWLGEIGEAPAVFRRPGMLIIPPRLDAGVRAIVASMRELGVPVELLDTAALARRFPFLDRGARFPPRAADDPRFFDEPERSLEGAVFEPDAGYVVSPGLATHNLRLAGEREGVRFRLNRRVERIREAGAGLRVSLAGGESLEADAVLNAAGPHSSAVNRLAGVELPLQTRALRREVHALANPLHARGESLPIVADLDGGGYLRPEGDGRDLVVGSTDPECDPLDWVDDPDRFEVGISDSHRERQCLRMMQRLPELKLGPRRGTAGLYDVTLADWYPIADRTELPGYFVCIGTSGSSFKTAPMLGALMAELIGASATGVDTDASPLQLELPRIGRRVDTAFLSRRRGALASSGSVIG